MVRNNFCIIQGVRGLNGQTMSIYCKGLDKKTMLHKYRSFKALLKGHNKIMKYGGNNCNMQR